MKVTTLLRQTGMWRASTLDCHEPRGTPTGFAALDELLAGDGWPTGGIAELLFDRPGIGEMRLLSPALARLSRERSRWLLWVSPPFLPYPPALARAGIDLSRVLVARPSNRTDALWTLEKALSSQGCSAVLGLAEDTQRKGNPAAAGRRQGRRMSRDSDATGPIGP
ncbi:MAG: SulA-like leucine-rich domain-containing protein [Gammaproteobacteria bacterium]|nr:SulA-like leucine-rich domain-containing protein [Gammaproteobacteria bacterium]